MLDTMDKSELNSAIAKNDNLSNENESNKAPSGGTSVSPTIEEIPDPAESKIDSGAHQSIDIESKIQTDIDSNTLNESTEEKNSETTVSTEHSSNLTECRSLIPYQHLNPIEFLNRIYQFVPDELRDGLYTYIWSRDNDNKHKRTNSFKLSELDKMLEVAENINTGGKNISFSMGLLDHPLGTYQRAKSTDIIAISCLWIDIDVANEVHGQDQKLAPTIETACEIITMQLGYDLKPSLVVDSGYGIHAYWIFNSLFKIESDADLKRFRRMLETLQGIIRANLQGYFIDKTSDLSRMLRLPGTRNWKSGNKNDAPICKVIETSNTAFEIDEFELRLRERVEVFIPKSKNPREISTSQRKFLKGKYSTSNAVFSIDTENQQIKMICEHCSAVQYVVSNIESLKYPVVTPIFQTLLKINDSERFVIELVKRWLGDKFDISTTEKQLEGLKKLPPAKCLSLLAMGLPCNGGENHECIVASLEKKTPDAIRTSPIVRRAISQDLGGTIGERFADAPDQIKYLSIPDVFEMYENGIDLVTEKLSKSVSLTPFAIQNLVQNEGSESIAYYNFAIRKNGRWIHRLIDAHIINKTADLANALLDSGILVDASQIRLANKFIIAFLATNETDIETITQYTKLGWCDNFEFIHPEFQFDNAGNALYKLIQSDVVPHIHCKTRLQISKRSSDVQHAISSTTR